MIKLYFSGVADQDAGLFFGAFIVKDGDSVVVAKKIVLDSGNVSNARDASYDALICGLRWLLENSYAGIFMRALSHDKKVISPMRGYTMRGATLFDCPRLDTIKDLIAKFERVHFKFIKPYNNRAAIELSGASV